MFDGLIKFFKTIGDLFSGIGEFLINILMPFNNTKNPLFKMPGIKIPVCYLHPFFVIAYLVLDVVIEKLTSMIMLVAEPLKYVYLIVSLGSSREKWANWFKISSKQKNKKLQKMSDNIKDEVDKNIKKILWVCFFMLALSFIFVPLVGAYGYQNIGVAIRVILQIMITLFIVGIIFINLKTGPIITGIITFIVYSFVRYVRIVVACTGVMSGSYKKDKGNTQSSGRLMGFLFVFQERLDDKLTRITNFMAKLGTDKIFSKYIFWPALPFRIIGKPLSGSWFSSSDYEFNDDPNRLEPDELYRFWYRLLYKIDIPAFFLKFVIPNGIRRFLGFGRERPVDKGQMGGGAINNFANGPIYDKRKAASAAAAASKLARIAVWKEGADCRERKKMMFLFSLYYGSIILLRLVIIPILIIRHITSLNIDDLLYNTETNGILKGFLTVWVSFLTILLIIIVFSTQIIVFPNPKVNRAAMKPFFFISRYMTLVFFPSFIIAYYYSHIVEGCFESYAPIGKIMDAMTKLGGQSKKSKMSAEQEKARDDLQNWLQCFYEENGNEKRAAKGGKLKKEATQKYKKAEQYKEKLIREHGLVDNWEYDEVRCSGDEEPSSN